MYRSQYPEGYGCESCNQQSNHIAVGQACSLGEQGGRRDHSWGLRLSKFVWGAGIVCHEPLGKVLKPSSRGLGCELTPTVRYVHVSLCFSWGVRWICEQQPYLPMGIDKIPALALLLTSHNFFFLQNIYRRSTYAESTKKIIDMTGITAE